MQHSSSNITSDSCHMSLRCMDQTPTIGKNTPLFKRCLVTFGLYIVLCIFYSLQTPQGIYFSCTYNTTSQIAKLEECNIAVAILPQIAVTCHCVAWIRHLQQARIHPCLKGVWLVLDYTSFCVSSYSLQTPQGIYQ